MSKETTLEGKHVNELVLDAIFVSKTFMDDNYVENFEEEILKETLDSYIRVLNAIKRLAYNIEYQDSEDDEVADEQYRRFMGFLMKVHLGGYNYQVINNNYVWEGEEEPFNHPIINKHFVALEKASGDPEQVNHPSHYNASKIEVIDILDSILASQPDLDAYQGFLLGNVIKYLSRLTLKGKPLQDANKAQWYLTKLIEGLS